MLRLLSALGSAMRSTGQALDGIGAGVQGKCGYIEKLMPTLTRVPFGKDAPALGKDVFVAPNAVVLGDVTVGDRASIWYGTVIRGDVNKVMIGSQTNLQDNVVVHVAKHALPPSPPKPTIIGSNVTVVGMGATLLDGVKMEPSSIVAAGALVPPKTVVGTGQVWAGSPAKQLRQLTVEEVDFIVSSAADYAELAALHLEENAKTFDQIVFEKNMRKDRLTRSPDYDSHLGVLRDPKTREIKYVAPI